MKTKSKITFLMFIVIFLSSCIEEKIESSGVLTEKGIVEDVVYTPSNHGSSLSPGMTTGGDMTITITSVNLPEKYAIIFRCHDHNVKFIIQNDQEKCKEMWNRLKEGQEVTIFYRQVYKVTYQDGKERKRELFKLDFEDAK